MQARLHSCTWLVPALLLQLTPLFSWTAADWYPHTEPAPAVCLQLRPPGRRRLLQPDGLAAVGEPITSGAAIINKHSPINTKDQVAQLVHTSAMPPPSGRVVQAPHLLCRMFMARVLGSLESPPKCDAVCWCLLEDIFPGCNAMCCCLRAMAWLVGSMARSLTMAGQCRSSIQTACRLPSCA